MLIEFRIENHRSIQDEQALTMQVGRADDPRDPRPRQVKGHAARLLPAVALYGANASGKSNLLSALGFMRQAVLESHRLWSPEGGIPREPFAWGAKSSEPSLFEVTVLIDGVRHQYGFVADDERFVEEWLYAWPHGRKQTWLEREGDVFKFGEQLSGENRLVEQITRTNALFLSAAVQHRHLQLAPLFRWFQDLRTVNVVGQRGPMATALSERGLQRWLTVKATYDRSFASRQFPLFDEEQPIDSQLEAFKELLRAADVGIVDFKVEEDDSATQSRWGGNSRSRVLVKHRSQTDDAWLPLDRESQGTLTLFRMGPLLVDTLQRGGVLLIDELEASLHPLLALRIVRQFNDAHKNPHNAQLIFTTHDTNLLGTVTGDQPLRRDQIWLTEKDQEGATCLYPLTDYKPRKSENLERGYLQGRFGAIPLLNDLLMIEK